MIFHGEEIELTELYGSAWIFHAWFMGTAIFLIIGGLIVAKFYKRKNWWLKTHKVLQGLGFIIILVFAIVGIVMVAFSPNQNFSHIHGILGLISLIMMILSISSGIMIFKLKDNTDRLKRLKNFHRVFSRVTILLVAVTGFIGIYPFIAG